MLIVIYFLSIYFTYDFIAINHKSEFVKPNIDWRSDLI